MHSRIFQISSNPIKEDNMIEEYRYEETFIGSVADYVVKQTSTEVINDLEWLQSVTEGRGIEVDIDKKTIKVTSKESYFEDKHTAFTELAEKLSNISLTEFIEDKNYFDFYDLKTSYDDKHSFYVDDNDEYAGTETLDSFVRRAEENKIYYIGSVFDYHF